MRSDSSLCPPDMATMDFFQFIKAPEGRDLYDMFNIVDQPSESLWEHHNNWWTSNKITWDDQFNPRGKLDVTWCRFIMWSSKLFMSVYMTVLKTVTVNPSLYNGEQMLWEATLMKNLILDMKLATKIDSKNPKTLFQRLVALRKYILRNKFFETERKFEWRL